MLSRDLPLGGPNKQVGTCPCMAHASESWLHPFHLQVRARLLVGKSGRPRQGGGVKVGTSVDMRDLSSRASKCHCRRGQELQTTESEGCRTLESLCAPADVSGKICTRNVAHVLIFGGVREGGSWGE